MEIGRDQPGKKLWNPGDRLNKRVGEKTTNIKAKGEKRESMTDRKREPFDARFLSEGVGFL